MCVYTIFSLPVDTPSFNLITGITGVNSMHAQQVNVNRHGTYSVTISAVE